MYGVRLLLAALTASLMTRTAAANSMYLFHGDDAATNVVFDYRTSESGTPIEGLFEESTKPRVVNFYSPYCVSDNKGTAQIQSVLLMRVLSVISRATVNVSSPLTSKWPRK